MIFNLKNEYLERNMHPKDDISAGFVTEKPEKIQIVAITLI
jgi:hypothetical protein